MSHTRRSRTLRGSLEAYLDRLGRLVEPTLGPQREPTEKDSEFLAGSISLVKKSQKHLFVSCLVAVGLVFVLQLALLVDVALSARAANFVFSGSIVGIWLSVMVLRRFWLDSMLIEVIQGAIKEAAFTPAQLLKLVEAIINAPGLTWLRSKRRR